MTAVLGSIGLMELSTVALGVGKSEVKELGASRLRVGVTVTELEDVGLGASVELSEAPTDTAVWLLA